MFRVEGEDLLKGTINPELEQREKYPNAMDERLVHDTNQIYIHMIEEYRQKPVGRRQIAGVDNKFSARCYEPEI